MYENVESFTLLGVDVVSHPRLGVSWEMYVSKLIKKAYSKMWMLKRLVEIGVSTKDLLMTYTSRVRVHLELNSPLFHFSINQHLSKLIEKVQKACVFIILGRRATPDYATNLSLLDLDRLDDRRDILCDTFAKKTIKNPAHKNMFSWKKKCDTRAGPKVIVPQAKTQRYMRSSIPSLARIINQI